MINENEKIIENMLKTIEYNILKIEKDYIVIFNQIYTVYIYYTSIKSLIDSINDIIFKEKLKKEF